MEEAPLKTSWKNRWACLLIAAVFALGSLGPARTASSQAAEPVVPVLTYFPLITNFNPNAFDPHVIVRNWPAFDTCQLPSLSRMETWWNKSPYWTVNLYLGGSAFSTGCNYAGLNSAWLAAADKLGWTFIPTWVGPQAPCAGYKSSISTDPETASNQGRAEADTAVQRARGLGFQNDLMIYLDVEAYAHYNDRENACRNVVNAYVSGWTARMHELGHKTGAYGSSCGSLVTSWSAIPNIPDAIWAAFWMDPPYTYKTGASVSGILCLADTLWANHQRIRQYAGDHNESWGGATLNIDSNITDGPIQAYGPGGLAAKPSDAAAVTIQSTGLQVSDIQTLSPGQGWVLAGNRIRWTRDGGATWEDRTPAEAGSAPVLDVHFVSDRQGWLAVRTPSGGLRVLRTADGGTTWQSASLVDGAPEDIPAFEKVSLEFVDGQTGWAALQLQTGGPFSRGMLYRTQDGGATWRLLPLPLGEPVRFAGSQHGWVAGGAAGNELFATRDGGETWQALSLAPVASPGQVLYGLPVFSPDGAGLLPVTRTGTSEVLLELYTAGPEETWQLAETVRLDPAAAPGSAISIGAAGPGLWRAALPDGSLLSIQAASGGVSLTSLRPAGSPTGITRLEFSGPDFGWAQSWTGTCSGDKSSDTFHCEQRTGLSQTADGGLTWSEITPAG